MLVKAAVLLLVFASITVPLSGGAESGGDGANRTASEKAWPATVEFLKKYIE